MPKEMLISINMHAFEWQIKVKLWQMSYSIDGLDTGARRGIKYRRENEHHPTAAADVYEQNLATLGRVDDWQKRARPSSSIHSLTHPLILRRWQKCA